MKSLLTLVVVALLFSPSLGMGYHQTGQTVYYRTSSGSHPYYYARSYDPISYYNDLISYRSSDSTHSIEYTNTAQIAHNAPEGDSYYPARRRYYYDIFVGAGCSNNPCGTNAICREASGGRPVCSCPPGHSGNPLTHCSRAECLDHSECGGHQACRNGHCINPCADACGTNAKCETRNHVPVCSCLTRYVGDPFSHCRLQDPQELCQGACGVNTNCQVINGVPTCSCLPGFVGQPITGCNHECESDGHCGPQEQCQNFKCVSSCNQCGKGAQCIRVSNHRAVCECPKNYIGSPYTECRAECYGDVDCPGSKPACIYGICKNPCDGACGVGADCNLRGLTPVCSCPRDMTGDPFVRCRPFTKEDLCIPNPCGANAQCIPGHDRSGKERPVCTCLPGYTGNALSNCVRGECQSDSECSDHRACVAYQCVDPCIGQCGIGAECHAKRHLAVCTCPSGTSGDALVQCRQSRSFPVARYNYKRK